MSVQDDRAKSTIVPFPEQGEFYLFSFSFIKYQRKRSDLQYTRNYKYRYLSYTDFYFCLYVLFPLKKGESMFLNNNKRTIKVSFSYY